MMTDTDILIEVAKLDGWIMVRELNCYLIGKPPDEQLHEHYKTAHIPTANGEWQLKPYLTSRDAIIPVIESQSHTIIRLVVCYLINETLPGIQIEDVALAMFTLPRQLCIALVKSTGRWKE